MPSIFATISEVVYEFEEVSPDTEWHYLIEADKNEYTIKVCKFGDNWFGDVIIKTHDGATMNFQQRDLQNEQVLIRRLVDYANRVIQIYEPLPMKY